MRSTKPFPETFRAIREMQGLSERQVSKAAARHGAPGYSTLNRLFNGENPPLPHHMRAIAAALGIDPDTFVEYRLWKVIAMFDVVGDERREAPAIPFDDAVRNLIRFEELTRGSDAPQTVEEELEDPVDPAGLAGTLLPDSQMPRAGGGEPA